jgi:hypothetical protein
MIGVVRSRYRGTRAEAARGEHSSDSHTEGRTGACVGSMRDCLGHLPDSPRSGTITT